ncbi:NAD(P)/FAD-dependent oxidoreductase [Agromyces binzhouensis]|uniref:NAD(P)/FAD-dependent oxidoreductase n=1 Tax=Agromyces binzhouensis TaxID=1817495 RepID=A0A4Q2JUJ3_9MICO|nr:NAD(P)/FAD-dependent oxidoreductase [Agromyces binzhouensis]RXZ51922.1 NAD(P)/FAD-dependent oxidoreductase [Agromyces binzhouensis]
MNEFDVVIIGGGAAGLTAAVVLLRARRTVAVVDGGAPRNAPATAMHGFLSRDGMAPRELIAVGRGEVEQYGGVLIDDTVTNAAPGFHVHLAGGRELGARKLLVATGLTDDVPDIPGIHERWGRDVLHCPYCHGHEVRGEPLGVLGGNAEAVQHALLIRQWSDDVTLFTHTDDPSDAHRTLLAARGIRLIEGVVARIVVRDDRVRGIELADGRIVTRAAVFVRPRFVPNSDLLFQLGCRVDGNGWVEHDALGRTSVPGVRVAGNAADPRAQVITAAGQGSAAAIAINAELIEDDLEHALSPRFDG